MPPKKTESASAAKPKSAHVSYQDMITNAIVSLKDRNGSSRQSLKKYVKANNKLSVADAMFDSLFNKALRTGVEKGVFEQPKGASGGTKLAKKAPVKKEDKVKKPVAAPKVKKPAAPVLAKAKKPAAKKETEKKDVEKKDAEKKAAPKASTKKAAPKKASVKKASTASKPKSAGVTKPVKKAAPKKAATKATSKKAAA